MIRYKSKYVRKMGLAGGMVWALDLDDFMNRCGQGYHPLMNTIKQVLGPKITNEEQSNRNKPPSATTTLRSPFLRRKFLASSRKPKRKNRRIG